MIHATAGRHLCGRGLRLSQSAPWSWTSVFFNRGSVTAPGTPTGRATVDSLPQVPYRGFGAFGHVRTDEMPRGSKGWLRTKAHEYSNAIRA
jgi:hypothetical protein